MPYDPEDGHLPRDALYWNLFGHGSLGNGEAVSLAGLAGGQYTLTLTASDRSAQVAVKSITVRSGEASDTGVYLPLVLRN
jgi:hypothetical protein